MYPLIDEYDVSHNRHFNGGFKVGHRYALEVDAWLIDLSQLSPQDAHEEGFIQPSVHFTLKPTLPQPDEYATLATPRNKHAFESTPGAFPYCVALIDKGTMIEVNRARQFDRVTISPVVVVGTIVNGPNAGTKVSLNRLARGEIAGRPIWDSRTMRLTE